MITFGLIAIGCVLLGFDATVFEGVNFNTFVLCVISDVLLFTRK